jgi:hypothetical protein
MTWLNELGQLIKKKSKYEVGKKRREIDRKITSHPTLCVTHN